MGYDLKLINPETQKPFKIKRHSEGGIIKIGGTPITAVSITYNYSWFYRNHFDKKEGIRWIYGRTGEEAIPRLEKAISILGTKKYTRTDAEAIKAYRRRCEALGRTPDFLEELKPEYQVEDYWCPTPGNAGHMLNVLLEWAKQFPKGVFSGD